MMYPLPVRVTILQLVLSMPSWLTRIGELLLQIATSLGGPGLLIVALLDSSFLSIPEGNDLLIVILSIGNTWQGMAYYVAMTTAGSIIGCLLLYSVGRKGGRPLLKKRFSSRKIAKAEALYEKYGMAAVIVPSIMPPPTPFKIFVLSAGVFRLSTSSFVLAIAIGRSIRYSVWGILAVLYGEAVKRYMQENLYVVGMVLFGILLAAMAAIITLFVRRDRGVR